MSFEIKVSELGQKNSRPIFHLELSGEASIYFVLDWKSKIQSLLDKNPIRIEIDTSSLEKVDSSFIQSLILLKKDSLDRSWDLAILNHPKCLLEFYDLYGLIGFFQDRIRISKKDSSEFKFSYGLEKV